MNFRALLLFCLIGPFVVSCQQTGVRPARTEPVINLAIPDTSVFAQVPPINIPDLDLNLLEGDEFIPIGATAIYPELKITVPQYPTPKGKYPSTEESIAPNGNVVVGSRSAEAGSTLHHWLKLYRRGDKEAQSIFQTDHSFETLWAQDSRAFAISHIIGKNESEVLTVRVKDDAEPKPMKINDVLARYFSAAQLATPRFEKAYRWSTGSWLVVRGIGRQTVPPYELFGYEVVVDSAHPGDPQYMSFIRGFVKQPKAGKSLTQTAP
jgi:hypothetical protein